MFALPGGFVGAEEAPEQTAERKLREKTGVGSVHLEQLRTYADPGATRAAGCRRSPTWRSCRPRTLPGDAPAEREASWHPVDALPELALDHARIVDDGLWRLRARVADKAWFVRVGRRPAPARVHARRRPSGSTRRCAARRSTRPTSAATSARPVCWSTRASCTPTAPGDPAACTAGCEPGRHGMSDSTARRCSAANATSRNHPSSL